MPLELTGERGLVFRITHVANVPWLLQHGLHAARGRLTDPNFVAIGNPDLIDKRDGWSVPIPPGGVLSDYVPFYSTPKSPMLLNIKTGWNGIKQRRNDEIAILVSSCRILANLGVTVLFTDRHAYARTATWTAKASDLAGLLDWDILRRHDFKGDDAYIDKRERYQAEALAHVYVPPSALLGIACASDTVCPSIESAARGACVRAKVVVRREWYF